jgi:hypothetical protein
MPFKTSISAPSTSKERRSILLGALASSKSSLSVFAIAPNVKIFSQLSKNCFPDSA